MEQKEAEDIAHDLLAQHAQKIPFKSLKDRLPTLDDAYDVQKAYVTELLAQAGGPVAGYKIGLPTKKLQAMSGIDEPIAGMVLGKRVFKSGAVLSVGAYGHLGLDSELCIVVDQELMPDCNRTDVEWRLRSIHAAFEVIDDRGADYAQLDAASLVADNGWNAGVVLGPPGKASVDLHNLNAKLTTNENQFDIGATGDALGHPLDLVVWLVRHLARRGERLKAGQMVMTGSVFASKFPKAGDIYTFEIAGVPPVAVGIKP
jgi:2-keto-4-pentenoate hydratase